MSIKSIVDRFKQAHEAGLELKKKIKLADSMMTRDYMLRDFWIPMVGEGEVAQKRFTKMRLGLLIDCRKNAPTLGFDKYSENLSNQFRRFYNENSGIRNALSVRMRAFSA